MDVLQPRAESWIGEQVQAEVEMEVQVQVGHPSLCTLLIMSRIKYMCCISVNDASYVESFSQNWKSPIVMRWKFESKKKHSSPTRPSFLLRAFERRQRKWSLGYKRQTTKYSVELRCAFDVSTVIRSAMQSQALSTL